MGVVGAVAEFTASRGEDVEISERGHDIIATTRGGAVRMRIDDDVRALTFDPPALQSAPRVVMAVKRERGRFPASTGVTDLGNDIPLIADQGQRLFDLGLGRKEARFCVRVGVGAAQDALEGVLGEPFAKSLPKIATTLIAESPTRVVEAALGRIEVESRIPVQASTAEAGPHTRLLPDRLAIGRALPVGMDLPRAYLPGAIFYPRA